MADQTVVWTTLPNGTTGDPASRRLRLSVLVSPRLTSPESQPTLADFPDFTQWPQRLATGQVAFFVQARPAADQPPGQPVLATVVSPAPDPDLWQAVFAASTPVESHTTDQVSPLVSTYSMAAVHDQLKQGHQALAVNSPVTLPTMATLSANFPASGGFTAAGQGPVLQTLVPAPGTGTEALQGTIRDVTLNMFRPDDATDLSQRVSAVIAHARQLAQDGAPLSPVEVMPRVVQDGTVDPASDLARVVAFTRGPTAPPPPAPTLAAGSPAPADPGAPAAPDPLVFDFHRCLTFLAGHPSLLRRLGLIIDLEVPAGSVPVSPSTATSAPLIQVLPAFTTPLEGDSVSAYTAYVLEGQGETSFFSPAPEPSPGGPETVHGLLNLALPGQFELIQIDVQGGALKLINTLATQADSGEGPDAPGSLPALRTSGVSIARDGLALGYAGRVATAMENDSTLRAAVASRGQPPVLYAEDLTLGYRFDVYDVTASRWLSLHQRTGTYTFRQHPGGSVTMPAADEGVFQVSSTQSAGDGGLAPDSVAEHYLHESLLHWQGWSLSVPRPGKTITDDGPATVTSTAPAGVPQVEVSYQVPPGSLPRLRFGRPYRFRVRTVDLAGNGLSLDEASDLIEHVFPAEGLKPPVLPATGDFTYCRFEPVAAPVPVPRARLADGETADRLVIRSRTGAGATQEAADLTAMAAAARPGSAVSYQPTCERHLVPPKTSQHMAETHGMLDASFGTTAGFAATYAAARKEKGRLTDTAVIDTATGQPVPLSDPGAIQVVATNPGTGDGYVVHGEAQLILPYLPDPMARVAALCGLPGVPSHTPAGVLNDQEQLVFTSSSLPADVLAELSGSTVHIPFGGPAGRGPWPDGRPFRLVLAERTAATGEIPAWDPQARVLTVFLSPGEQASVRLSSSISLDDLNQLGQWQWLLETSPGAVAADLAQQGGRWQLTPGRTLTLVHAVEQPLLAPNVTTLTSSRQLGMTAAYLNGELTVHGESTGKIDVLASWEDVADPPGAPLLPAQAHVFDITVPLPGEDEPPADDGVVPVAVYEAAAHTLTIQGPPPGDESGRTYLAQHEFGDTLHRTVRYSAVATSRFGDCFPPEVAADSARMSLAGSATQVNVLSSKPPAAADLVSVVPAFTWSRVTQPDGSRSSTRTGGVRVYLRRPWYSSGAGELLAVILTDPATYPPDPEMAAYVTHWGRDPIWPQPAALDPPAAAAFPGGAMATAGPQPTLTLQETQGESVFALGYEVAHDPGRDLLWCDIAIDPAPDSYFPMVRLALARYQPDSVPGCELSPVVLTDFVQIPPERTVTVSPDPAPDTFRVSVQGFSPIPAPFIALVRVSVEQRIAGIADADLGWMPVPDGTPGVTVNRTTVNQPPVLWDGQVTLPAGRPAGQFRIIVREQEPLPTDELQGAPNADGRLVFAETFVL